MIRFLNDDDVPVLNDDGRFAGWTVRRRERRRGGARDYMGVKGEPVVRKAWLCRLENEI